MPTKKTSRPKTARASKSKVYTCIECDRTFNTNTGMNKHYKTKHKAGRTPRPTPDANEWGSAEEIIERMDSKDKVAPKPSK